MPATLKINASEAPNRRLKPDVPVLFLNWRQVQPLLGSISIKLGLASEIMAIDGKPNLLTSDSKSSKTTTIEEKLKQIRFDRISYATHSPSSKTITSKRTQMAVRDLVSARINGKESLLFAIDKTETPNLIYPLTYKNFTGYLQSGHAKPVLIPGRLGHERPNAVLQSYEPTYYAITLDSQMPSFAVHYIVPLQAEYSKLSQIPRHAAGKLCSVEINVETLSSFVVKNQKRLDSALLVSLVAYDLWMFGADGAECLKAYLKI